MVQVVPDTGSNEVGVANVGVETNSSVGKVKGEREKAGNFDGEAMLKFSLSMKSVPILYSLW